MRNLVETKSIIYRLSRNFILLKYNEIVSTLFKDKKDLILSGFVNDLNYFKKSITTHSEKYAQRTKS